uniref:Stabilin 2 n=1 Tax=Sphenodon punctatus TaxID=8508 RepID=A0A8D0G4I7_SPHPU
RGASKLPVSGLAPLPSPGLTERRTLANRCDQKTLVTTKTVCRSCSLNFEIQCPDGYTKITNGSGIRDCRYYLEIRTYTLSLPGCRHMCMKEYQQPQCCQGYWGPDCLCKFALLLYFLGDGGGQKGFGGTACETCVEDHVFGPNCTSVCNCVHGVCSSGITGDGTCTCMSGYKGLSCDQPIPECQALQCPENSRCSASTADEGKLECKCLPSYQGDGKQCERKNIKGRRCGHHICFHKMKGFQGDGQVCLPIDPCQTKFENCPTQSTICKYDGPGKSHCECKEHYRNFVPGVGCSMTDICATNNTCHQNAKCTMVAPGQILCSCLKGYVGDGLVCYGNIMERIRDLNTAPGGQWQGKLTSAILLFEYSYEWPLSSLGPFTVLVPTNKGFKGANLKDLLSNKENAQYFVKLHIIAGQLDINSLNNTDTVYTLTGKPAERLRGDKDTLLRFRIQGTKKKGKLLQGDIVASNGIFHITDKAMDNVEPTFESNKEETIMAGLQDNARYSRFRSMLEKTILGPILDQDGGPYTIFVPNNGALEDMKDGVLDYLLSPELEVASLVSIEHVRSMARQFIYFNTTSNGQILVNGAQIEETDIVAKNGRIYTLARVLIPPSIVPILPHRCDVGKSEIKMVRICSNQGLAEIAFSRRRCIYDDLTIPRSGCARYCNVTIKEPTCCEGFYGPDCNPCPGGFSKPCSGNGQCVDGMKGNGTCICNEGFQGSHCQFCSDPDKYGPRCDNKCLCVYGTCDNQIHSDGICLVGSCKSGYAGKLCDTQVFPCGYFLQFCHAHANCQFSNGHSSPQPPPGDPGGAVHQGAECIKTGPGTHECVCQPGWSGDGRDCSEINNCLLPNFGGCHGNASCMYVVPSQNNCECKEGFRGNGIECAPINSCLEHSGKCHHLANCQLVSFGVWDCVCPKGFEGDGIVCYGNAVDELSSLSEAAGFNQWVKEASIKTVLSATSNLTVLVPSLQAIENMNPDERAFWISKSNIPALLKYHVLMGAYRRADLQNLSSSNMLATSLHGNFLPLTKENGNITVDGANIIAGDIAATNGIIHVIDKVLIPLRGMSGVLPKLLARLEQMPDYSIFRGYVIQYNLENEIEAANTYTVFAPNNDAIESYLRSKKMSSLDEDQIRYHIVLEEKLLKNDLHNGMHRETMLGFSYQVGFFFQNGQVSKCRKHRLHHLSYKMYVALILKNVHALGDKKHCIYTDYFMGRISIHVGCQTKCIQTIITRECCAGFFGQQCQPCPGNAGNMCFGNGICLDGVNGTGVCECEAGFNGTACEKCIEGKYGSSCDQECACVHGKCSSGIEGDGTCECAVGWRGVNCESEIKDDACNNTCHTTIDACETSNGGCSAKAECKRTTAGNRLCFCTAGYTGDGVVCLEINPCLENNGGCDKNAECTQTGPNQVSNELNNGGCSEFATCNDTELAERTCTCKANYVGDGFKCRGTIFQSLAVGDIAGSGPYTVFIPNTEAFNSEPKTKAWTANGVMPQILRYHMVGCAGLLYNDLTSLTNVTTLQGNPIRITVSQNSVYLNDKAKIVSSDAISTNGVIHIIDKLLIPQFNLTGGEIVSLAFHLFQSEGLMSLINDPLHSPVTLFWPTDNAIRSLPKEQKDFLFKKSNREKLVQYLKFHIIRDAKILASDLPGSDSLKTLQGSDLSIKCGDDNDSIGELFLNDRKCKIVERQLEFNGGIAYGIDCMLMAPSLGSRCDNFIITNFTVKCYLWLKILNLLFFLPFLACPGGPETPCNNRGYCDDGYSGTGECMCNSGFNGTSCELCPPRRYGSDCKPCECTNNGQCDEGHTGSGQCFCETGWTGRLCDTKLDLPPVCSPNCSVHAVCNENSTCQCKPYYKGDGLTCTVVDLCSQNNGGCHQHARCSQYGVKTNCTCNKGYKGDGHTCVAINPCADGLNGGCHEHAICTMTAPDKRKCECKDNYIGDGIDCSVKQLPIDRCLQDNGQCHADANCSIFLFVDATVGAACANEGATVATYNQLVYAQKARYHLCSAGWLDNARVAYPTAFSTLNCGSGYVGIIDYGIRVNLSESWDAFCYRVKDVNCTCKTGYVGDGITCSGNLLQVLMSLPTLTNFNILTYSNSSKKGKVFLEFLTNLSIQATLFAPNKTGLTDNETLSGRDIEYHLSNVSTLFYEDLANGTTLQTKIGERLLVTHGKDQDRQMSTIKYVDGKVILEWDIIASNGVIHVIAAPLKAPPAPVSLGV